MKKLIAIILATLILILPGCRNADPDLESQADPTQNTSVSQTDPDNEQDGTVFQEEGPEFSTSEPESQTDPTDKPSLEPSASTDPQETKPAETKPSAGKNDTKDPTKPTEGKKPEGTTPPQTKPTDPATEPTSPPDTTPPATEPPATTPPETEPPATEAPTEPETTEPAQPEITYEFKRQVASYTGKKIRIAFHYTSTDSEAATWEIKTISLKATRNTSGITAPQHSPAHFNPQLPYRSYTIDGRKATRLHRGITIIRQKGKSYKVMEK